MQSWSIHTPVSDVEVTQEEYESGVEIGRDSS